MYRVLFTFVLSISVNRNGLTKNLSGRKSLHSQWLIRWTPFAGDHLHQFKAAAVQLNVSGVVVLCVDLTRPQRATVFGLRRETKAKKQIRFPPKSSVRKHSARCESSWVPYICSWFSSWGWSRTPTGKTRGRKGVG